MVLVLVLVLQNGLGYIAARLSFCRSVSQDHFLVCFTISAYKCDNGCYCLFAYRDVSTVLLGAVGYIVVFVQLCALRWVLLSKCVVWVLVLQ